MNIRPGRLSAGLGNALRLAGACDRFLATGEPRMCAGN